MSVHNRHATIDQLLAMEHNLLEGVVCALERLGENSNWIERDELTDMFMNCISVWLHLFTSFSKMKARNKMIIS